MNVENKLNLLIKFLNATYSSLELSTLLNLIMDLLTQIFKSEVGIIFGKNKETDDFQPLVNWGLDVETIFQLKNKTTNLSVFEILKKERIPFFVNQKEIESDYVFNSKKQLNNLIGAPLFKNNELIGSVFLVNKSDLWENPLDYDEEDLNLFNIFSGQIANALSNALLYDNVLKLKNYNTKLINAIPLGLLILDKNKNIKFVNKQVTNFFFYEEEDLLNKPYSILLEDEFIGQMIDKGAMVKYVEITVKDKKGNTKTVLVSMVGTNNTETDELETVIMLQDISEEQELKKQVERSKNLSALGVMTAEIAHELKNPLAAIKGYTDLIPLKKNDPAFLDKYVGIVNEEMERLTDTIKMLLTFARGKSEKMKDIELETVLKKVLTLISPQAKSAHISIQTHFDCQPHVFADARQLEQVFLNITQNAIQAMDANGTLTISTAEVERRFGNLENSKFVQIQISDTGSGISEENLEKIFTPFFTTKDDGNGLGLPICFKIIQEHNGTILVDSKEGEGTTFSIYLPLIQ